jgi:hypothetical protein
VNTETATAILVALTGVAVMVWLTGLQFLRLSARKQQRGESVDGVGLEDAGLSEGRFFTGGTEIDGPPAALASKAASLLARGALFSDVPVKIVEKSDSLVRFERVDPGGQVQSAGRWFRRGQLSFSALGGNRSRVEWAIELTDTRWLLKAGYIFQIAGLIAIVAGCWLLYTFVVPAREPGLQWQVVQMVQTVHFLWPPFLFGTLYRRAWHGTASRLEALAHNLPFLKEDA